MVSTLSQEVNFPMCDCADMEDFSRLREDATVKYKDLQEKAQPVMKVIEDPEAVAKLRSGVDREKNLDLLRSDYNVSLARTFYLMVDQPRPNQCSLSLRSIPIYPWSISRGRQFPLSFLDLLLIP